MYAELNKSDKNTLYKLYICVSLAPKILNFHKRFYKFCFILCMDIRARYWRVRMPINADPIVLDCVKSCVCSVDFKTTIST